MSLAEEFASIADPTFADYTRLMPEDRSMIYKQYVRIQPNGGTSNINSGTSVFQISDLANWYLLRDAFILQTFQLQSNVGGAGWNTLPVNDPGTALMSGGFNIWSNLLLKYAGQPLHEEFKTTPGMIANMIGLCEYSEDYTSTGGTASGFIPDLGDGSATSTLTETVNTTADATALGANLGALMAQIQPKLVNNELNYNKGHFIREQLAASTAGPTATYQTQALYLRDVVGFCKDVKVAMKGGIIELYLYKESNQSRIIFSANGQAGGSGANTQYRVYLTNLELWIPQVKPNTILGAKLDAAIIENKQSEFTFRDWCLQDYTEPLATQLKHTPFNISNPKRLIYAMTSDASQNDQTQNAGIFNHYNLVKFNVQLNGRPYPQEPMQPNFLAGAYTREYHDFLEIFGKSSPQFGMDHASVVNWKRFGTIYPMLCVDLSKRDVNQDAADENTIQRVDTNVTLGSTPAAAPHSWILLEVERKALLSAFGRKVTVV